MADERKFPKSYPCPCCKLLIKEQESGIYECGNFHKFALRFDDEYKKRVLKVLQGCEEHKEGDECVVDAIWPADIPGLKELFNK